LFIPDEFAFVLSNVSNLLIDYTFESHLTHGFLICQALAVAPHDPLVHHELGLLAYKVGDYSAAVTSLRQCVALTESMMASTNILGFGAQRPPAFWAIAHVNLGHAYRMLNPCDLTMLQGLFCCRSTPNSSNRHLSCFWLMLFFALVLLFCLSGRLEQYDASVDSITAALSATPHRAPLLCARGLAHHLAGRLNLAIDDYHAALAVAPHDSTCHELLARAFDDYVDDQSR
jgi:tetratricopeptide (TPR) repeat protein